MKKLLRYHDNMFAMSFPRKVALQHLSDDSSAICEHVLKCILYRDIRHDDMYHWIHDELSSWLADASQIKCDSKLKLRDILDTTFGQFGNEEGDSLIILKKFRRKYCDSTSSNSYPYFEITVELVENTYETITEFKNRCAPKLLEKTVYTQEDWYNIINPILNK